MTNTTAQHRERTVEFQAGDGFRCNLIQVLGDRPATKGPVMLVHGAGVRANIFRAPVKTTVVDYLLDQGYDVWLENWRASIDLTPNKWTLDQAALYDHPQAVKTIAKETGSNEIKAIIHCQGSTSFIDVGDRRPGSRSENDRQQRGVAAHRSCPSAPSPS